MKHRLIFVLLAFFCLCVFDFSSYAYDIRRVELGMGLNEIKNMIEWPFIKSYDYGKGRGWANTARVWATKYSPKTRGEEFIAYFDKSNGRVFNFSYKKQFSQTEDFPFNDVLEMAIKKYGTPSHICSTNAYWGFVPKTCRHTESIVSEIPDKEVLILYYFRGGGISGFSLDMVDGKILKEHVIGDQMP